MLAIQKMEIDHRAAVLDRLRDALLNGSMERITEEELEREWEVHGRQLRRAAFGPRGPLLRGLRESSVEF